MNVTLRLVFLFSLWLFGLKAQAQTNPIFYGVVTFNNASFAGSAKLPPTMLGIGIPSTLTFLRGDGRWMPLSTVSISSVSGTPNEIDAQTASGAVTLSLPSSLVFTGKTVTGGSFTGGTYAGVFTGNVNGIANSANTLTTPRNINGVPFDGSAAITVTAAANTLSGSALASGVTSAPGLLSVSIGTLQSMALQSSSAIAVTGGNMTGVAVTGLPTPSVSTDAATKGYVDSIGTGIVPRTQVRVASTANIASLSGLLTIDGVTVIAGDRVLVKNNTTTAQNGIYDAAAGAWSRSSDSDTVGELLFGYYYLVTAGSTQTATSWFIQTAPATINVSPVIFAQFSAAQNYSNGTGLSLTGTVFAILPNQNFTSIGLVTPGTGAFTTLGATGLITGFGLNLTSGGTSISSVNSSGTQNIGNIGNVNGTVAWGVAADGHGYVGTSTNNNFNIRVNGSEIAQFTSTGMNTTVIGASTPAAGTFTALNSTSGALNGSLGATTPSTVAATSAYASLYVRSGSGSDPGVGYFRANDGSISSVSSYHSGGVAYWGTLTNQSVGILVNNSTQGLFTGTGMNSTAIGQTTAAAGAFTTLTGSSTATGSTTSRTLANRFGEVVNVKDFGATGNGSTDDKAAINLAIAALTSHSTLYFPPGKYRITGQLNGFSSLTYVTMTGEGAEIYNDSGASGSNTIGFDSACSNIEVSNLSFTGTSTVRANGIHIRSSASYVNIHNCYFQGCSDFAVLISGGNVGYCSRVVFADNIVNSPLGDGVHVGSAVDVSVTGNIFTSTGDDGIAVISDYTAYPPNRVNIVGNYVYSAGGLGSSVSGVGIRVEEAIDVLVSSNQIYTSYQSGIDIGRYTSTTARNVRISINDNKVYNSMAGGSGPRAAVWINFCDQSNVTNNQIIDPVSGAGICILDCNDLNVTNNFLRGLPFRGIVFDDSTTTNVAASWTQISITNNNFDWVKSNEAIYAVPASGKTLTGLLITGNTGFIVGGNWIYYDRITTGRVYNNTNTSGATVAAGGSVSGVTTGNNF